ncbi:MAG: ATP-grasp domain-containing protein [Bacteroidota bacterium]
MKFNVAVSGLNATDNPAPGVAVIRSLREEPEREGKIIGLCYDAYEPGIFDPHSVDSVYLLPYPSKGKDALMERMTAISKSEPIDLVFPNLDSELDNFVDAQQELNKLGIQSFLPTRDQLKRRAKKNLPALAKELELEVPESKTVSDLREAERAAEELTFPLMVKGLFYEAFHVSTVAELFSGTQWIAQRWGFPVLLQKYIPGEEYNLAGLGDGFGGLVSAVCMKKVFVTDKGKGWAGVSILNEDLFKASERFVSTLKWRGGFELETLISDEGRLYLIEVNPRFPAWIYLAKACGINLPYAYCQLALGKQPNVRRSYDAGVMFVHYTTDLVANVSQLESLLTRRELHHGANAREAVREIER